MAITSDLLGTDIVLFYSGTFEWWYEAREYNPSKGLSLGWFGNKVLIAYGKSGIRNDKERRGMLIDVEEEEEERRDTENEEEQGKANDYQSIIVYDLFDSRYYLDDDHSTNKFNSNQNDVDFWPIIDFSNLYLISKIFNAVYRKNEVD
ncbi:hypothetical protein HZH68_016212 [Vespula germanica]|uniref:Uncharacterized protein n=1 Tax=Vespula germanica TaxID=30212 RepID=A0A834J2A4_VESGE|nr:hypothetical protein HZH68_016212 [Vespula germanica]